MSDPTDHVKLGKDALTVANRGVALHEKGNHDGAIADFTTVLELLSKTQTRPLYAYGSTCRMCGFIQELPPSCTDSQNCESQGCYHRGVSYLALNSYDKAIADLTRAVEKKETVPQTDDAVFCPPYVPLLQKAYEGRAKAYRLRAERDGKQQDAEMARGDCIMSLKYGLSNCHSFTVPADISRVDDLIGHFLSTSEWGKWREDTHRRTKNHRYFSRGSTSRHRLRDYEFYRDSVRQRDYWSPDIPWELEIEMRPEPKGTSVQTVHHERLPDPELPFWGLIPLDLLFIFDIGQRIEDAILRDAKHCHWELTSGRGIRWFAIREALALEDYLNEMTQPG